MSKLTKEEIGQLEPAQILELYPTKSAAIRDLHDHYNFTRGQISNLLKIRYQHVRNVMITPVKTPKQ